MTGDITQMNGRERRALRRKLERICANYLFNVHDVDAFAALLANVFVDSVEGYFTFEFGEPYFQRPNEWFFYAIAKAVCGGRKPRHVYKTYDAWDDGSLGPLIGFEWRIGQVKFVFHHLSRREAHRRHLRPGWVMETITPEEEQEWSDNDTESNYSNEDDD